jgi:hypothetical protein
VNLPISIIAILQRLGNNVFDLLRVSMFTDGISSASKIEISAGSHKAAERRVSFSIFGSREIA